MASSTLRGNRLLRDHVNSPANIATYAALLGVVGGLGIGQILSYCISCYKLNTFLRPTVWVYPSVYAVALCLFHWLEYVVTALYMPDQLTIDSFLIYHSREYHLAVLASLLEFWVEAWWWPELKLSLDGWTAWGCTLVGLGLVVLGQLVRSSSMARAGKNFNHHVQEVKREGHELVTEGVYAWMRHPSYFGFFHWQIGLQLFMRNPVILCVHTAVLYRFFKERIEMEEFYLVRFFGPAYNKYRENVWSGIYGIH